MKLKAYALFQAQANREIERKKLELGGPEGNVEDDVVAEIARNVLNKLIGDEKPHCFGAGVTKSQISKFSCDLRKMRGEVITNENRVLLEKVQTQKKQLETQKNQLETQKKQLENQNKEIETHKKQLEVQGLQLKDMGQKLNELYGMLQVVETAFPGLYNGASTSGATGASPLPDHYPGMYFNS